MSEIKLIPNKKSKKINFSDIKYLKLNFWIVSFICSLGYASFCKNYLKNSYDFINPFIFFLDLFIQKFEEVATEKLKVGNVEAGNL